MVLAQKVEVLSCSSCRGGSRILVGGPSGVLTPRGAQSPKFAQNRGSSLKIAWKLHDFEQILGAREGPQDPLDPVVRCHEPPIHPSSLINSRWHFHRYCRPQQPPASDAPADFTLKGSGWGLRSRWPPCRHIGFLMSFFIFLFICNILQIDFPFLRS